MSSAMLLLLLNSPLIAQETSLNQPAPDPSSSTRPEAKSIAVTFDDLPLQSSRQDLQLQRDVNDRILAAIGGFDMPVVGFVNERKLFTDGVLDESKVAILRAWLAAGLDLGNHTFSHADLHRVPVGDFEREILAGERVIRDLIAGQHRELRWFRHPYLHTGRSLQAKTSVEQFLAGRAYRVAPVTIDNSEWIFARAYDNAHERGDAAEAKRIGDAYIGYMDDVLAFYEEQCAKIFQRQIRQVLLLHVNRLNADRFAELARRIQERGYRFVSLESALQDPIYQSTDEYTGPGGITWIHRWAITRGVAPTTFAGEPVAPAFVLREAGFDSE